MQNADRQIPLFPPDDPCLEQAQPGGLPGFSVRESARAKRLSIKVYPRGRVEVVVPRRTLPAEVASFVAENRDWIRRAREELHVDCTPADYALPTVIRLVATGQSVRVRYDRQKVHDFPRSRFVRSGAAGAAAAPAAL